MSVSLSRMVALLADPRVTGPPLRVARHMRARGVQRLPAELYDMDTGRVRRSEAVRVLREWLDGERLTRHRGRWVLNSFLPPFPSAAYARMFNNVLSGRPLSPVSAFLAVTARCPLRCRHCSLGARSLRGEMTGGEWLDVIRQVHEIGASIVGFTGGEPCLRDDLPELVSAATQGGAEAILFTSGAGFTAVLADSLRKAGLWSVCVSLDSDHADEHDGVRGDGAFDQAIAALRIARASGFYTMIGTLATPASVEQGTHEDIHALCGALGVHEMRIVEPMPCGRLTGCDVTELLTPEQVAVVRRFHVETNRRGVGAKVCAFNQIESPEVFGCGAGTEHLFVAPDGVVCPCDFTPLGFGSVRDTPLASIYARMSTAMGGNPRSRCFVQTNRERIWQSGEHGFPLSPEASEQVCADAGAEPLPTFFRVLARRQAT